MQGIGGQSTQRAGGALHLKGWGEVKGIGGHSTQRAGGVGALALKGLGRSERHRGPLYLKG